MLAWAALATAYQVLPGAYPPQVEGRMGKQKRILYPLRAPGLPDPPPVIWTTRMLSDLRCNGQVAFFVQNRRLSQGQTKNQEQKNR